jgi:pimeloyl-ACP methyl ester carboxylesterase
MQTHFSGCNLPWGRKSRAHWAVTPTKRAIVFVHGFGGDAIGTWQQFPRLLALQDGCCGHDLIFFGYDGLRTYAQNSAVQFREFLRAIGERAASVTNPLLDPAARRPEDFAYEQITVVAHSLGAVVTRRALLDAHLLAEAGGGFDWLKRTQMILFAPAHMGANVLGLATSVMITFQLHLLGAFAKHRFPVLADLEEESRTLTILRSETLEAMKKPGSEYLRAKRVILADKDKVVWPHRFANDPPPETLPGTHTSICKPSDEFVEPVQRILEVV